MEPKSQEQPGYPVVLRLQGRRCLVVGGGNVAEHKVRGLLDAGAIVTVLAPWISPAIGALGVERVQRAFQPGDTAGHWFVVSATGDRVVEAAVAKDASSHQVFCNAADDPSSSSVFLPAIAREGSISIAVSSNGASPSLTKALRDEARALLGPGVGLACEELGRARSALRAQGISTEGLGWSAWIDELLSAARAGASREALAAFIAEHLLQAGADAVGE